MATRNHGAFLDSLANLANTVRELAADNPRINRRLQSLEGRVLAAELRAERLEARCRSLTRRINKISNRPPMRVNAIGHQTGTRSHDATRTREHLQRLTDSGWQQKQIAQATGLSPALISGLATGNRPNISPRAEALILTITPKEAQ